MKVSASARSAARVPVRRAGRAPAPRRALPVFAAPSLARLGVQPALLVGAVNDPLEHEAIVNAERVAAGGMAQVAGAGAGAEAPPAAGRWTEPLRREGLGDQPDLDQLDQVPPMPETLKEPTVPEQQDVDAAGLDAADMGEIESGGEGGSGGGEGGEGDAAAAPEEPIQTDRIGIPPAAVGPEGGQAPPAIAGRVADPGAGRPLPGEVRREMEHSFGADFSAVRLHDREADRADAAALGARAFTHGSDIWLGPGEHHADKRLMAHELTHVVQQTGRRSPEPAGRAVARAEQPAIRRSSWLEDKAESIARNIPGYTLLCVILGKSPITGEKVPRTAENLVGGFMGLIPGGTLLFDQLKEAHVIQDAFDWVSAELTKLDISWARLSTALDNLLSWRTLRHPIQAFEDNFGPIIDDIITFGIALKNKIIELIIKGALKLAGPYADKVWEIINSASDTIKLILDDPLGFAKNLLGAVVKGFGQFKDHIVDHLKRGLMGWLFGAIAGADLKMPAKLDLKGLLSIGFQLLGLTWERMRAKIVKKLDPEGERKVSFVEKAVDVIQTLITEGFAGIWLRMLDYIEGFKQTVIEGIKSYVMTTIVTAGIQWLAAMTNPVGAIIKLAISIYKVIKTFLERLEQILDVAKSLWASINNIAKGNIDAAANTVEETIGRTVPVVISFVASLLNLDGISGKIRDIIKQLRKPVDTAIDKMLNFLIKKAKQLFSKLVSKLNRKRKLPSTSFKFGKGKHKLVARKNGKQVETLIASQKPEAPKEMQADEKAEVAEVKEPQAKKDGEETITAIGEVGADLQATATKIDPDSEKANNLAATKELQDKQAAASKTLEEKGEKVAKHPQFATSGSGSLLFRAREPRFDTIEGQAGTYAQRGEKTKENIPGTEERYSIYYENDHLPEKQYAKAIEANLADFKPGAAGGGTVDRNTEKTAAPPAKKEAAKPRVGEIGKTITKVGDDATAFPAISLYRPVHKEKGSTPANEAQTKVRDAAKSKAGPLAALQAVLKSEIKLESDKLAMIIKQDKSTEPAIKKAMDEGLQSVRDKATAIYGLNAIPKEEVASAQGAADTSRATTSLSDLPFTGKTATKPDFTELEGKYQLHGEFGGKFGQYMEYDHVVDAAWPLNAKELNFGLPELKEKILTAVKSAKLDPADPKLAPRLADLRSRMVFSARQKITKYDRPSGMAIALYRPIHRVVTAKLQSELQTTAVKPAGLVKSDFATPMVSYLQSGDTKGLENARAKVQADLREKLVKATEEHASLINSQYEGEARKVETVNPAHQAEAKAAIEKIAANVKASLGNAKGKTEALF